MIEFEADMNLPKVDSVPDIKRIPALFWELTPELCGCANFLSFRMTMHNARRVLREEKVAVPNRILCRNSPLAIPFDQNITDRRA